MKQKERGELTAAGPHPAPKTNARNLEIPLSTLGQLLPIYELKGWAGQPKGPSPPETSTFHELLDLTAPESSSHHECAVTAKFRSQGK